MSRMHLSCGHGACRTLNRLARCGTIISMLLTLRMAAAADDAETDASAKANVALVARLNSLQNLVVDYKLHENHTPPVHAIAEIAKLNQQQGRKGIVRPHTGPQDSVCTFRYLEGRYWLESRLTEESMKTTLDFQFSETNQLLQPERFREVHLADPSV